MRFELRRSERCVAVATAKSSLTGNKNEVRSDTSLGFLMKLPFVSIDEWRLFLIRQIDRRAAR